MSTWDETPEDLQDMRRRTLFQVFTPAAPVDRKEVFSGRTEQLAAINEVIWQRGQHAVIYGERGVGKTSLAKVGRELAIDSRMFNAHVTCHSDDSFESIWRNIFSEIAIATGDDEPASTAIDFLPDSETLNPNEVRAVLQRLAAGAPVVVFIDEFDVVEDASARRKLAETIKILSDQGVAATIVTVGVAESVTDLITEHASTERNLIQVPMPRMAVDERRQIIDRGLTTAEMSIEDSAAERIALLSQGLAQFVHLLTQRAALVCLANDRTHVSMDDVRLAVETSLKDIHASVTASYYAAVKSNRETLYPSVLLACALAEPDERGFFTAKALVEPISRVAGRRLEIPAFGPHLNALSSDRGPVLDKEGESRRFRYRFKNPLMQPFVLMKGVSEGSITFDQLDEWVPKL